MCIYIHFQYLLTSDISSIFVSKNLLKKLETYTHFYIIIEQRKIERQSKSIPNIRAYIMFSFRYKGQF